MDTATLLTLLTRKIKLAAAWRNIVHGHHKTIAIFLPVIA
jgi:hypothetical protein